MAAANDHAQVTFHHSNDASAGARQVALLRALIAPHREVARTVSQRTPAVGSWRSEHRGGASINPLTTVQGYNRRFEKPEAMH